MITIYVSVFQDGVERVIFPGTSVEAFKQDSLKDNEKDIPDFNTRLSKPEIIEGILFESIEHVILLKKKYGRTKDSIDIKLLYNIN